MTEMEAIASTIRVFLFAELRDYTSFSEERGDEAAVRLVGRFAWLTRDVVEARGGRVVEMRGDEAMVVFTSAREALRAAVELQERFAEETEREPSLPLRAGVGLDVGEAQPFEGGFRGRALNVAARLKDQARAGQVVATEALIHVAGQVEGLTYVERGLVQLKGIPIPVRIVQVVPEGQSATQDEDQLEPELRAFLFADIGGYFAFGQARGDAWFARFEAWYEGMVAQRVQGRGGRVLNVTADEVFAAFVSPRQAILAAVELQESFERAMKEQQLPLMLKIGVEAGEAVPSRGRYTGQAVLAGVRVCNLAGPGEVRIGETIARLVRGMEGLTFVDRGEAPDLTGFGPLRTMQVLWETPVPDASGATGFQHKQ